MGPNINGKFFLQVASVHIVSSAEKYHPSKTVMAQFKVMVTICAERNKNCAFSH
jgi:hypothetical protein